MKKKLLEVLVFKNKITSVKLVYLDMVYVYPDHIVEQGYMNYEKVGAYLAKRDLCGLEGPFRINKIYEEDGEVYLVLITKRGMVSILAKYCIAA